MVLDPVPQEATQDVKPMAQIYSRKKVTILSLNNDQVQIIRYLKGLTF